MKFLLGQEKNEFQAITSAMAMTVAMTMARSMAMALARNFGAKIWTEILGQNFWARSLVLDRNKY